MRLGFFAKILIMMFLIVLVMSFVSRCSRLTTVSMTKPSSSQQQKQQLVQAPVVQQQPVQAPPQPQSVITIEPMSVEPQTKYAKGKIIMDVYNLDPCTTSDIVPHVAIFHTNEWTDISSQDFKLSRISSSSL